MNSEKWQKIKEIFNRAVELAPADGELFLQNQNGTSAEILGEVRKLLAAEKENYFEKPLANLAHLWQEETFENVVGSKIGVYKIVREIGRGGMGIVFEARRETADFSQTVALKLLKKGMDSEAMLRRFRRERQILASLEHPNIARLLDGGMSADGLPFFAMEFVDGKSLDECCRAEDLSVAERLRIFLQICVAVSFAHSRLVVHRDLKPNNIFVTADGSVKLLDFGIAKIISSEENPENQTVTALKMMTPAYASPEQVRGETISTASDIYSLGLILYELLTGVSAYRFSNNRPDEIAKIVCESEPERPSSVVSGEWFTAGGKTKSLEAPITGRARQTNPKSKFRNSKSLRGDLDNIVLKALRKEPARRYASVEQFAGDIQRHLDGLPVIARPDTLSYRLEKFVSRHRVSVVVGVLLFLSLIGGISATAWQAVRAERERATSEKRFNQVRSLANSIVFKYHDAIANLDGSTEVRQMLVKDATDYLDALSEDANADSDLKYELALAYLKLADVQGKTYNANVGDTKGALENYQKSVGLLEELLPTSDVERKKEISVKLIAAYQSLGSLRQRNFDYAAAVRSQQKALNSASMMAAENPTAENRHSLTRAMMRVGDSMADTDFFDDYLGMYEKALPIAEELNRIEPEKDVYANAVAVINDRIGRKTMLRARDLAPIPQYKNESDNLYQTACSHLEISLEIFKNLTVKFPNEARYKRNLPDGMANLALCLKDKNETERALLLVKKALDLTGELAAADSADKESLADLSEAFDDYATVLSKAGKYASADDYYRKSLELIDKTIDSDAENIELYTRRFRTMLNFGDSLAAQQNYAEAERAYALAYQKVKDIYAAKNSSFNFYAEGLVLNNLGDIYLRQNKSPQALAAFQKTLELWNDPAANRTELNRSPESIEWVREKISNINRN